ncbi:MAG: Gfo/Idh/MocA family protein [Thermoproteota archaeon]
MRKPTLIGSGIFFTTSSSRLFFNDFRIQLFTSQSHRYLFSIYDRLLYDKFKRVRNSEEGTTEKVGVAVVGVGFVGGSAHTPSFKKIPGSELVALCARTESRVKQLSEKYGVRYYLDYDELLRDPKVDAVILAVPTPSHFNFAMKAIEKRKHVLCEMPLTPTVEESRKLAEEARKAGVILMPVLNFRFTPAYLQAKEMIENGAIEEPIAVHYREFIPIMSLAEQWPAGSWAWDIEKSGGYPDFTLAVWSLDMLPWMFGSDIESSEWMSNYRKFEEYGGILGYNTMGILKFSNGIVGSVHLSASVNQSASTTRLEVFGSNTNVLHVIWNNKIILYGSEEKPKEWDIQVSGTRVWGHRQIDEHFIDCILNKKEPKVTVEDAIKAIRIAKRIVK